MTPFSPKSLLPLGAAAVALFAVFVAALTVQLAPQLRTQVQTPAAPLAALPPPGEAPSLTEAPPSAEVPPPAPEAALPAAPGALETPGEQPPVPAPAAVPVPPPPPASASSPALSPLSAGGKEISSRQPQPAAVTSAEVCGNSECELNEREDKSCRKDCGGETEEEGDGCFYNPCKDPLPGEICTLDAKREVPCGSSLCNEGPCDKDDEQKRERNVCGDGNCDAGESCPDDCEVRDVVSLEEEDTSGAPEEETTGQPPSAFSVLTAPFKLAWETFRFSLFAVVSFFGGGGEEEANTEEEASAEPLSVEESREGEETSSALDGSAGKSKGKTTCEAGTFCQPIDSVQSCTDSTGATTQQVCCAYPELGSPWIFPHYLIPPKEFQDNLGYGKWKIGTICDETCSDLIGRPCGEYFGSGDTPVHVGETSQCYDSNGGSVSAVCCDTTGDRIWTQGSSCPTGCKGQGYKTGFWGSCADAKKQSQTIAQQCLTEAQKACPPPKQFSSGPCQTSPSGSACHVATTFCPWTCN